MAIGYERDSRNQIGTLPEVRGRQVMSGKIWLRCVRAGLGSAPLQPCGDYDVRFFHRCGPVEGAGIPLTVGYVNWRAVHGERTRVNERLNADFSEMPWCVVPAAEADICPRVFRPAVAT